MKKRARYIVKVTMIFVILSSLIFIYSIRSKNTNVIQFVDPITKYNISIKAIGEPKWPFGESKVKVTLFNNKKDTIKKIITSINNDGIMIRKDNVHVTWHDDYVEVILSGNEQDNKSYKINY